ncbi:polyprenyl synthetase family protein [Orrella marina]|nr:farnesyl diphosphate synthase [Orrella marina]
MVMDTQHERANLVGESGAGNGGGSTHALEDTHHCTPYRVPEAQAAWLEESVLRVERALERLLPEPTGPLIQLNEAIRWASLGSGKRIRALLVYASAHACCATSDPATDEAIDRCAAAVELVHAYSLIHDDLPCMDDDDVRRGKPATHIQFGEATALLAGDAMQPMAYEWLAGMPIAPGLVVQAVQTMAVASGVAGMAGGQAIDLASSGITLTEKELEQMHSLKTGALLEASVMLGAVVTGSSSVNRQSLRRYASAVGLAFQVIDDVLDATADSATLGKTAGKDSADQKATYVSLLGVERARAYAFELNERAQHALQSLGSSARYLKAIANLVVQRSY